MRELLIITDVGTFKPTRELQAAYNLARLTKKNKPDMRTKAGRHAWRLFELFQAKKIGEFARGVAYD